MVEVNPTITDRGRKLTDVERRTLRFGRLIAFVAPILAASASFSILRMAWVIGGRRWRLSPRGDSLWSIYEWGIFPANALIGAVVAGFAIWFLHPVPGRRVKETLLWLLASPVLYVVAYVAWERFWRAVV